MENNFKPGAVRRPLNPSHPLLLPQQPARLLPGQTSPRQAAQPAPASAEAPAVYGLGAWPDAWYYPYYTQ